MRVSHQRRRGFASEEVTAEQRRPSGRIIRDGQRPTSKRYPGTKNGTLERGGCEGKSVHLKVDATRYSHRVWILLQSVRVSGGCCDCC